MLIKSSPAPTPVKLTRSEINKLAREIPNTPLQLQRFHLDHTGENYVISLLSGRKLFTLYVPKSKVTLLKADRNFIELEETETTDRLIVLTRRRRSNGKKSDETMLWDTIGETSTFRVGVPDPNDPKTWP